MSKPQRELEIKFSLTPEQRLELLARQASQAGGGPAMVRQALRSIYFDTGGHALRAQRISWRLRHDGHGWRQTIKFDTGVRGGVSSPLEVETHVAEAVPDPTAVADRRLRKRLAKIIGAAPLVPQFEIAVERRHWRQPLAGDADVEVSVDQGGITAGAAAQPICEMELELKAGPPQALLDAVDRLFGADIPAPAAHSKAGQGFALLSGEGEPPPTAHKATLPAIDDTAAGVALAALVSPILTQILHNWQTVLSSDDPEGPHQLRIGIRRLRTLLKAFAPLLDAAPAEALKARLRDLAKLVGTLRDADVQVADIVAPVLGHRDWGLAAGPLHELLMARRDRTRHEVRTTLQSPRFRRFRLELGLLPALIAHHAATLEKAEALKASDIADEALRQAWKRVSKRAGHIADLGIDERHGLRKDLKTLRYTVDCFAGLYSRRQVAAFTARLSRLQDLFGYLNDVATAQRLMAELSVDAAGGEARLALGYVIGWHTAQAEESWKQAIDAWGGLHRQKRFWRE